MLAVVSGEFLEDCHFLLHCLYCQIGVYLTYPVHPCQQVVDS
jgi:hypothetical protein